MWALFALYQLLSSRNPATGGTQVAPVVNPLLLLPATQLARKIRRKEVRNRSEGAAHTRRRDEEAVEASVALKRDITVLLIVYPGCACVGSGYLGQARFVCLLLYFCFVSFRFVCCFVSEVNFPLALVNSVQIILSQNPSSSLQFFF